MFKNFKKMKYSAYDTLVARNYGSIYNIFLREIKGGLFFFLGLGRSGGGIVLDLWRSVEGNFLREVVGWGVGCQWCIGSSYFLKFRNR